MQFVSPVNHIKFRTTAEDTINFHISKEGGVAVDITNGEGTPVYATFDGKIEIYSTAPDSLPYPHLGNCIYIHGTGDAEGLIAVYAHLQEFAVSNGQTVKAGSLIGKIGHTGYVRPPGIGGAHLHFTIAEEKHYDNYGVDRAKYSNWSESLVAKALGRARVVGVDNSQEVVSDGTAQGEATRYINTLPQDVPNIVPEKVAFVIDGSVGEYDWDYLWPSHSGYVGSSNASVEVPKGGTLTKLLFVNHNDDVVGELNVNQKVETGDIVNIDYTFSLQKFIDCSILTEHTANELMHHMVQVTLGYQDGHKTYPFTTNEYDKTQDGGRLEAEINAEAANGTVTGGDSLPGSGKEVAAELAKQLPKEFATKEMIATLLGHAQAESTFNPHAVNPDPKSFAMGLWQWLGSRAEGMLQHFGHNIKWVDIHDLATAKAAVSNLTIEDEVWWLIHEPEYGLLALAKKYDLKGIIHNIDDLVRWFNTHFEVCGDDAACNYSVRLNTAKAILGGDLKVSENTHQPKETHVDMSAVMDSYNWLKAWFKAHPNVHFVRR